MIFINPKTDFAFKKIFGSDQSHQILISFLNGILYGGESTIQDLTILNPYQAPRIRGVKESYLDIKAKLHSGENIIVEMQVLNVAGFEKRILYNATKSYSMQLDKAKKYNELDPVIALTITDFKMFEEIKHPISRFVLKEENSLIDYPISDLQLVFVELPKFTTPLSDLTTLTDKWIYFMQHAPDLEFVPERMGDVIEIQQAFEFANKAILTRDELDELEHQAFFIQDQQGAITYASNVALEKGRKEGQKEGARQAKLEIARQLLSVMDDRQLAEMTGLTIEDIQSLRS